jgi:hypothetical protein
MPDAEIRLLAAEFSYKPVQSLGCDFIDVAIASAGPCRWREGVSHFLCEFVRERMKILGPILQLILPDADEFRGRFPIPLIEHIGREPVLKCFASLSGNAWLMEEDKQQALMKVGYSCTGGALVDWMNFLHLPTPWLVSSDHTD